jgi:hypothetical protein
MFLVVFFRLKQWKPDNSADCLAFFKEHVYLGFIIFLVVTIGDTTDYTAMI